MSEHGSEGEKGSSKHAAFVEDEIFAVGVNRGGRTPRNIVTFDIGLKP